MGDGRLKAEEMKAMASDWLARRHPGSVIVDELSVSEWGGALIDLAAVTDNRIVGVEIKGQGDSPARLPLQGVTYSLVAREMWLFPDESLLKRCLRVLPTGWGVLEVRGGRLVPLRRARQLDELSPGRLCGTLWRDELYVLALRCGVEGLSKRSRVRDVRRAILDQVPVTELHRQVVASLGTREWKKPVRRGH